MEYRNLLFFRCRNIFGRRSPSENLLREYFSYVNFFIIMHAHACKTRAKKEDEYLPAATARARSTKDVQPALLQAAAAIVRVRIFINAHSSPPLSRFTRNFFELEIFSDDAACPKIKSHEKLSNENFANEKKANYGILWDSMCTVVYWAASITENSETE